MNPFADRLETLTYDDLFKWIDSVKLENQRIEIKREYDADAVARIVAAFANAIGGVVFIGFADPKNQKEAIQPIDTVKSVDEASLRAIANQIQARIYPSCAFELLGYRNAEDTHRFIVVRVRESMAAPHELLSERGRLPIRRPNRVDSLSLAEIEQLIARRDGVTATIDPRHTRSQIVSDPYSGGWFFGIRLHSDSP